MKYPGDDGEGDGCQYCDSGEGSVKILQNIIFLAGSFDITS
jgi:hypothetical protein